MKKIALFALFTLLLTFAAACNRADHNAKEQIEAKMKNAKLDRVDVSVKSGEATLKGEVNDEGQKAQAEVLARETPGVGNVKDNLRVVYKEQYPGEKGVLTPTPTDNIPPSSNYTQGSNPQPTGGLPNHTDMKGPGTPQSGTPGVKQGEGTSGNGSSTYSNPAIGAEGNRRPNSQLNNDKDKTANPPSKNQ